MILAYSKIIPPKYFEHDPTIADECNWTVAHHLAAIGIIPPE